MHAQAQRRCMWCCGAAQAAEPDGEYGVAGQYSGRLIRPGRKCVLLGDTCNSAAILGAPLPNAFKPSVDIRTADQVWS